MNQTSFSSHSRKNNKKKNGAAAGDLSSIHAIAGIIEGSKKTIATASASTTSEGAQQQQRPTTPTALEILTNTNNKNKDDDNNNNESSNSISAISDLVSPSSSSQNNQQKKPNDDDSSQKQRASSSSTQTTSAAPAKHIPPPMSAFHSLPLEKHYSSHRKNRNQNGGLDRSTNSAHSSRSRISSRSSSTQQHQQQQRRGGANASTSAHSRTSSKRSSGGTKASAASSISDGSSSNSYFDDKNKQQQRVPKSLIDPTADFKNSIVDLTALESSSSKNKNNRGGGIINNGSSKRKVNNSNFANTTADSLVDHDNTPALDNSNNGPSSSSGARPAHPQRKPSTNSQYSSINQSLFENLNRNWSLLSASSDTGDGNEESENDKKNRMIWEQACLASFVCVFEHLPSPPISVVNGLWSKVVLPDILLKTDEYIKTPEIVSHQIFDVLVNKLQYLQILGADDDNHDDGTVTSSISQSRSGLSSGNFSNDSPGGFSNYSGDSIFSNDGCGANGSGSSSHRNTVTVTHDVYVEYGHYLAMQLQQEQQQLHSKDDSSSSANETSLVVSTVGIESTNLMFQWKHRFGEWLQRVILTAPSKKKKKVGSGVNHGSTTSIGSGNNSTLAITEEDDQHHEDGDRQQQQQQEIQIYASQNLLKLWLDMKKLTECGNIIHQPRFLQQQLIYHEDSSGSTVMMTGVNRHNYRNHSVLRITMRHLENAKRYFNMLDSQTSANAVATSNNIHVANTIRKLTEISRVYDSWFILLENEVDGFGVLLSSTSVSRSKWSASDKSAQKFYSSCLSSGDEAGSGYSGISSSYNSGGDTTSDGEHSGTVSSDPLVQRLLLSSKHRSASRRNNSSKLRRRAKRRIQNLLERNPSYILMLGRTLFVLGKSLSTYLEVYNTSSSSCNNGNANSNSNTISYQCKEAINSLWKKQAEYYSQALEILSYILIGARKKKSRRVVAATSVRAATPVRGNKTSQQQYDLVPSSENNVIDIDEDYDTEEMIMEKKLVFRVAALLCAEVWLNLSKTLDHLDANNVGQQLNNKSSSSSSNTMLSPSVITTTSSTGSGSGRFSSRRKRSSKSQRSAGGSSVGSGGRSVGSGKSGGSSQSSQSGSTGVDSGDFSNLHSESGKSGSRGSSTDSNGAINLNYLKKIFNPVFNKKDKTKPSSSAPKATKSTLKAGSCDAPEDDAIDSSDEEEHSGDEEDGTSTTCTDMSSTRSGYSSTNGTKRAQHSRSMESKGNQLVLCLQTARQLLKTGDPSCNSSNPPTATAATSSNDIDSRSAVGGGGFTLLSSLRRSTSKSSIKSTGTVGSATASSRLLHNTNHANQSTNGGVSDGRYNDDLAEITRTLRLYKETLHAQVNESMGRILFDRERYNTARKPLEEAVHGKRAVLALLRDEADHADDNDDDDSDSDSGSNSFENNYSFQPGNNFEGDEVTEEENNYTMPKSFFDSWTTSNTKSNSSSLLKRNTLSASAQRELRRTVADAVANLLCLPKPHVAADLLVTETEMSLAQTLEITGLSVHRASQRPGSSDNSMTSLSCLQEALILKTMHLGKLNHEVANLHESMGNVHDDLGQWDTSVSRYRECLKIRMHFFDRGHGKQQTRRSSNNNEGTDRDDSEKTLFASILQTLRDMGNAYRMLQDYDNALGCYWKIANLARKQWEIIRSDPEHKTYFCGFSMDSHKGDLCPEVRRVPMPSLVIDEQRRKNNSSTDYLALQQFANLKIPMGRKASETDKEENELLRDAAQAHQTVIEIFNTKAAEEKAVRVSSGTSISSHGSSNSLASMMSDEDIPLLLSASYQLGVIHMFFGDYKSAIARLENSLRSLWILDPCTSESSSEGTYSDDSASQSSGGSSKQRRRLMMKIQKRNRGIFDKNIEVVDEEGIYHTLGLSRAACNEHDRAVRYHLTALRFARRTHGVDSLRAADILYDAGTSYWYMNEYEKAGEFWSACLQIRILHQPDGESLEDNVVSIKDHASNIEFAKTLYNVAATHCAMGRYADPRTIACLEDAKGIFLKHSEIKNYDMEVANCSFYLALAHYKIALTMSPREAQYPEYSKETRDNVLIVAGKLLNEAQTTYQTCWYDANASSTPSQGQGGPILKAHYLFLQGSIFDALGHPGRAIRYFAHGCHIYKSNGGSYFVHAASVLFVMGNLYQKLSDDRLSLNCFEECLQFRRKHLGPDHEVVATTLFVMANIHARLGNYETGIEMYHETLRIQLISGGEESADVATTLLKVSALHAREGLFGNALECIKGALHIRKQRANKFRNNLQIVRAQPDDDGNENDVEVELQEELATEEIELGMVLYCMGNVHAMLKDLDKAISCYDESIALRCDHVLSDETLVMNENIMHIADTLHNLGCAYDLKGKYEEAFKCYLEALKLKGCYHITSPTGTENSDDKINNDRSSLEVNGMQIILHSGNSISFPLTEEDSQQSLLDVSTLDPNGTLSYAVTLHKIGSVCHHLKHYSVAIKCFETALRIQMRHLGADHNGVARTLSDIASSLSHTSDRKKDALQCYHEALRIRRKHLGTDHAHVGSLLYSMGGLYDNQKDYALAASCYRHASRVYGRKYLHAIGRSFLRLMFQTPSPTMPRNDHGDIFDSDIGVSPDQVFTMKDFTTSMMSIDERNQNAQDHYVKVHSALRAIAKKKHLVNANNNAIANGGGNDAHEARNSPTDDTIMLDLDLDSPDCFLNVELLILGVMELMYMISDELHDAAESSLRRTIEQFDRTIGSDAIITAQDTMAYQMLYLIQE